MIDIDPDIFIFISFQSSSFTLQMEFKGFRKGRMNSILLHKCSIWMQIFGHLSNVHRTQFSGSVSTGWTNYLYESSMNTDECRSLVDTSEEGISGACGWFFRRNAVATYVVLDYSVSLSTTTTTLSLSPRLSPSFWQLVSDPFHPHLIDHHPSSRSPHERALFIAVDCV